MIPAPAPARIRVCLLDDHRILIEGLARMLAAEADLDVVALCVSASEALAASDSQAIDVFLLDFRLKDHDGFAFLEALNRKKDRHGRVLVLAAEADDEEIVRLATLGAWGLLLKNSATERLLECIRKVAAGEPCFSAHDMSVILRSLSISDNPDEHKALDGREREVLRGLLEGLSNKQIADSMGIRESTVKFILQNLFHKTGVHSRSQLVRFALEHYHEQM
jgi:two-component system, NarL family, nitrate/nitrite response regulator NarL